MYTTRTLRNFTPPCFFFFFKATRPPSCTTSLISFFPTPPRHQFLWTLLPSSLHSLTVAAARDTKGSRCSGGPLKIHLFDICWENHSTVRNSWCIFYFFALRSMHWNTSAHQAMGHDLQNLSAKTQRCLLNWFSPNCHMMPYVCLMKHLACWCKGRLESWYSWRNIQQHANNNSPNVVVLSDFKLSSKFPYMLLKVSVASPGQA